MIGSAAPQISTTGQAAPDGDLWAIVLAGGEGTRLSEVTRALEGRCIPKQFASYGTNRTFLQRTMDRVGVLAPSGRTVVVVSDRHRELARRQLEPFACVEIVGQPASRGTAPGVLLPLAHVLARDPGARVAIFPSDHDVREVAPFRDAVLRAVAAAAHTPSGAALVGAMADRAATDLGWILPGQSCGPTWARARVVGHFHEKPDELTAHRLLSDGGLWNTLIIAGRARALWEMARRHLPAIVDRFDRYARACAQPASAGAARVLYDDLPEADISRDVLAPAQGMAVVEMTGAGWSDCGTPERLQRSLQHLAPGHALSLQSR